MRDGYMSTDKREAVEYIEKVTTQLAVKLAAQDALKGEASLDSALVKAHDIGNQLVVKHTANAALGIANSITFIDIGEK